MSIGAVEGSFEARHASKLASSRTQTEANWQLRQPRRGKGKRGQVFYRTFTLIGTGKSGFFWIIEDWWKPHVPLKPDRLQLRLDFGGTNTKSKGIYIIVFFQKPKKEEIKKEKKNNSIVVSHPLGMRTYSNWHMPDLHV